jgi:gas vesicle protein
VSFLAGSAFGAVVALLAAPESGQRTRRRLRRAAEDAQEYLEHVGERIGDRADDTLRAIERKAKSAFA